MSLNEYNIHEIPVAKDLVSMIRETSNRENRMPSVAVSYDPFSYQRRPSEIIHLPGISGSVGLGGEEIVRVLVRQTAFEKIAHKVERMGDYKPDIVYENAAVIEIDPRDDAQVAQINEQTPQRPVTFRAGPDFPVIAGFRALPPHVTPQAHTKKST